MAFTRKEKTTERKKKVKGWNKGWKKMGKQKLSKKKGISQKLHLPRSRIHRSRCRSRSRCLPWPAVTQRPLRSLRRWKGMIKRDEELQHIELCNFCYMFHQFSRFFQHISLIWCSWSIFTSGLIYFYLNKSGKKTCRRGFLLNAKHKQPFFSTSKRAKSCMIFSCAAGHHRFAFQDSGTREKNHKLLQSRHILNLQKILRKRWCTSTFKWPNDTSISLRRLGSRHDLTDQGPSHAAAAPAWF